MLPISNSDMNTTTVPIIRQVVNTELIENLSLSEHMTIETKIVPHVEHASKTIHTVPEQDSKLQGSRRFSVDDPSFDDAMDNLINIFQDVEETSFNEILQALTEILSLNTWDNESKSKLLNHLSTILNGQIVEELSQVGVINQEEYSDILDQQLEEAGVDIEHILDLLYRSQGVSTSEAVSDGRQMDSDYIDLGTIHDLNATDLMGDSPQSSFIQILEDIVMSIAHHEQPVSNNATSSLGGILSLFLVSFLF